MAGRLRQWIAEESYHDVKHWIQRIVRMYQRRKGGDFYELLAEANFIFAVQLDNFDPNKGRLTTFLYHKIWGGLLDYNKRRKKHPEEYIEELPHEKLVVHHTNFLVDFLDEIGKDARLVVQQVLQPDPILMMILQNKDGLRCARRSLREYFVTKHEWSYDRVDNAFWDITTALWKFIT